MRKTTSALVEEIMHSQRGDMFEGVFGFLFGGIVLAVLLYFALGFAVDKIVPRIPPSVEKQIFSSLALDTAPGGTKTSGAEDSRLSRLEPILARFEENPETPDLGYRLFAIDDKTPNAVAMPGGAIGVTTGLLDALKDETGLAFVLGHEIGHFKNRDHLRGLGRALGLRIIVSYLFGDSQIAQVIGTNALTMVHRKYSRTQEESADRFGVYLVYNAYGTTDGTTKLFEMLRKTDNRSKWAYMFSTHPAAAERIHAMKKYAAELEAEKPAAGKDGSNW